jgi:hypothetical protein
MDKGTKANALGRAWVAALLINVLVLKLVLGSVALLALGGASDAASVICHSAADEQSSGAPAGPQDHHCEECCLLRAAALEPPPLPVAVAILLPPREAPIRRLHYAARIAGPPVEAWSAVQAQRAPPSGIIA